MFHAHDFGHPVLIVFGILFVIVLYVVVRDRVRDASAPKRVWTCIRFFGGGKMDTPYPMTELVATVWLAKMNGEVAYIDRENGYIFYKPRGGVI